jgi:protein O-GlcNAc transferase
MNIYKAIQSAIEHYKSGDLQQAELICKKILKKQPKNFDAFHLLGIIHYKLGNYESATKYTEKALNFKSNVPDVYINLGAISRAKGQLDDAITYYQKALRLNPNIPELHNNLGNAFREKGQLDDAMICFKKALELNPSHASSYYNLGNILEEKGELDEAIICYQKTLLLNPDFSEACSKLTEQLQKICAWEEFNAMMAKLSELTRKALLTGRKPAETPFHNIARHTNLSLNFDIAKSWSHDMGRNMSNLKINFSSNLRRIDKAKIVIGYLSNDFYDHATAHLMLSLFGLHNRYEFDIFCYSYGKDDESYYRKRIQHDCDKFFDISSLSYIDAARWIYKDQVDILVDLKGHTKDNRLAICALRPAPIQVSYLGFPGTTGADFIDYIITDKIVTPEEYALYFSEKFVYMPHCYQVNDQSQLIAKKDWKKGDLWLPESSFVFCSFNASYKIDPVMFDVWMRILRQVPESVLWLLISNQTAQKNLRREAEARGVKSERIIFAEKLSKDEHLARLQLADLALDTRIYNGHTTTSDALWAGVPVVTLQGTHFASRVSSSVLSAIGLPELITHSLKEFEALAVQLALNTADLHAIRQRLAKQRLIAPLFDTPRFVRNLESAYKEMWATFLKGEASRQIQVLEKDI